MRLSTCTMWFYDFICLGDCFDSKGNLIEHREYIIEPFFLLLVLIAFISITIILFCIAKPEGKREG